MLLPSTCYPKKNINNNPKGIVFRLRRVFDKDEKFDTRSYVYQNYIIARDYKPTLVKREFHAIKKFSRHGVGKLSQK